MLRPLCFMIMPYDRKPTQAEAGKGPAEVDFNALWDRAYVPVIEALGYVPVRADRDAGALIIKEMIERLYFSDLVLADITIGNANVYYEIGIRHASRHKGCVLLAADWSRQLFDVAQMRMARYPLPEGDVTEATASAIHAAIQSAIPALAEGESPMHASLLGYPSSVDEASASSMRQQLADLSAFQAQVRAVRAAPRRERMAGALALVARHGRPPMVHGVARSLVRLLVGSVEGGDDWARVLEFIDRLPPEIAQEPEVKEQRALVLSKLGRHADAIGALEELIEVAGATPERLGLLGGRYKVLWKMATDPAERRQRLLQAIQHYEQGAMLDLNEYYCSSNLARLYRERNNRGDEAKAQAALQLVIAACERAVKRDVKDPWLRPTLLGAAFDAGDADKAEELADQVAAEGAARWMAETTFVDLKASASQVKDAARREGLTAVLERLESLIVASRR